MFGGQVGSIMDFRMEPVALRASLVRGRLAGAGAAAEVRAPDGRVLARVGQLSEEELEEALRVSCVPFRGPSLPETFALAGQLKVLLARRRDVFIGSMMGETGFVPRDCIEMFEATLDFLEHFPEYYADSQEPERAFPWSYPASRSPRRLRLLRRPYGAVAVVLPQNAFLSLSVVAVMCALASGNHVILRPPGQSGGSAALLASVLQEVLIPPEAVQIAVAGGREFLEAFLKSDIPLLHYIGSSRYIGDILSKAFEAGKEAILDGEGNGLAVLAGDFPAEEGARIVAEGATRYNGATCTSINGVLVEAPLYPEVCERVCARMAALRPGDPSDPATGVGPLFSGEQAARVVERVRASGGQVAVGGKARGPYLEPTVVLDPDRDSDLAREGVFGPVVWLKAFCGEEWQESLRCNRYPLSCTLLSFDPNLQERFLRAAAYARIVLNGDPTLESPFEPWGAYPRSGLNRPSPWPEKYQRIVQVDEIMDFGFSV